jgi:very-short-patch-repair endonuclease
MSAIEQNDGSLLSEDALADYIFSVPPGAVRVLGGIGGELLRLALDGTEAAPDGRLALFLPLEPTSASTMAGFIEGVIGQLSEIAYRLWPLWFGDVRFDDLHADTLGRRAAEAKLRQAAENIDGLDLAWANATVQNMLEGKSPRLRESLPAVELAQLALAIHGAGIVLLVDADAIGRDNANPVVAVQALEWIAQKAHAAVVALFANLPPNRPPFERLLFGARQYHGAEAAVAPDTEDREPWIAPWHGRPHPGSEIEQRLYAYLKNDQELADMFEFNRIIETVRGSKPKVDLVWQDGKLVIEVDGYGSHGNRTAFLQDRHRDYELLISGYTVLRLTNDEIGEDLPKSIEKIRDLVHLRKATA